MGVGIRVGWASCTAISRGLRERFEWRGYRDFGGGGLVKSSTRWKTGDELVNELD